MGNLWFVRAIDCNVRLTHFTKHKFPVYAHGMFKCTCMWGEREGRRKGGIEKRERGGEVEWNYKRMIEQ